MQFKKKWAVIAGSVILTGALASGAAFAVVKANTPPASADQQTQFNNKLDDAVKNGKITQNEADLLKQIQSMRQSRMQQLKTDVKALVDQAVKDGKITQDQANQLQNRMGPQGHGGKGGPGWHQDGKGLPPQVMKELGNLRGLNEDQVKAKLADAVKAGQITQVQADKLLQFWQNHQSQLNNAGKRGGRPNHTTPSNPAPSNGTTAPSQGS